MGAVKAEIGKLFRMKILILPICIVLATVVYSLINYGSVGDWDAYGKIISNFFQAFALFVIVFAVPVFTYERECKMMGIVSTTKYGGELLLKNKIIAVFIVVNTVLFVMLTVISLIYFIRFGFDHAEVSMQYGYAGNLAVSAVNFSMGKLTAFRVIFGIVGCNMALMVTVLFSMTGGNSLSCLGAALFFTWAPGYTMVHVLVRNPVVDIMLAVFPANTFDIDSLIRAVPGEIGIYMILMALLLLLAGIIVLMQKIWKRRGSLWV